ncbi:MAG: hypothetical protein R3F02_18030 [Thiolinea sp.]
MLKLIANTFLLLVPGLFSGQLLAHAGSHSMLTEQALIMHWLSEPFHLAGVVAVIGVGLFFSVSLLLKAKARR